MDRTTRDEKLNRILDACPAGEEKEYFISAFSLKKWHVIVLVLGLFVTLGSNVLGFYHKIGINDAVVQTQVKEIQGELDKHITRVEVDARLRAIEATLVRLDAQQNKNTELLEQFLINRAPIRSKSQGEQQSSN